ncbi:MAG TPA: hypothetical protein VH835_01335 [Dongiaceae bacterium]|jgi:hypothetical protein
MTSRIHIFGLLFAAAMALAHGAAAQSVADTMTRWGLTGTWALDCSKPASDANGYLSYVARSGGKVSHERDFGGGKRDSNDVQRAVTGIGGALELVVHFPRLNQTRKYTMLMGSDRRIRAMANSRIDGKEQTIRNGRFTHNNGVTPWQTRCR